MKPTDEQDEHGTDEKTAAELATDLESERVNRAAAADDDEPEPETEPEPEPETTVDDADDGMSDELRARRLGKLVDKFEADLCELLDETGPLTPVPMDGAVGFMFPGMLELKTNDRYRRCSVCNGHGQVLTGSMADGRQTADCPRCAGRGYLEQLDQHEQTADTKGTDAAAVDPDAGFGVPAWMGDPSINAGAA